MTKIKRNAHGVPQYPKGHAGRLLVALAAVATLERPTSSAVAELTGLSKGNIDKMVLADSRSQFGVIVEKEGPIYRISDWGNVLKPDEVIKCLTVLLNRTKM